MHITMIKKRLANGDPCEKCAQTEDMLRRRGLWDRIDDVVIAQEGDPDSEGNRIGAAHGVNVAPFFVVRDDAGEETVYKTALKLVRDLFPEAPSSTTKAPPQRAELDGLAQQLDQAAPDEILRFALERYGERCAIAFSGAEDVVLIDMATRLKLPFSVFTLDTGRLHSETYEYLDEVRRRYGVVIQTFLPDAAAVSELVQTKGTNSFYRDGHQECCGIRKIEPMRRALARFDAWVTGQRRDQSPPTRARLPVLEADTQFEGAGELLLKLNPLAHWSRERVWRYIREESVPTNPLHGEGYTSIGCAPCTRATGPDEQERAGRWWWEAADRKECGIHGSGHLSGDGI